MPGLSRVYYSNSGSEANEKGYKIVRQIAHKHHGGKKHKILYRFDDASDYGVKAAKEIEKVILAEGPETVGSIVLEPMTAGGGVITPPEGYWETVQEICKKYDVLLHIDEVVLTCSRLILMTRWITFVISARLAVVHPGQLQR